MRVFKFDFSEGFEPVLMFEFDSYGFLLFAEIY